MRFWFWTQASIGDGGSEIGFQATRVFSTVAAPDITTQDRAPLKIFLPRLAKSANPIFEKPYCPWQLEVISIARGFPGSVQPVVSWNSGVVDSAEGKGRSCRFQSTTVYAVSSTNRSGPEAQDGSMKGAPVDSISVEDDAAKEYESL